MPYPAALETFATIQPGDRIEVTHEIKVGFRNWNTKTIGTVPLSGDGVGLDPLSPNTGVRSTSVLLALDFDF